MPEALDKIADLEQHKRLTQRLPGDTKRRTSRRRCRELFRRSPLGDLRRRWWAPPELGRNLQCRHPVAAQSRACHAPDVDVAGRRRMARLCHGTFYATQSFIKFSLDSDSRFQILQILRRLGKRACSGRTLRCVQLANIGHMLCACCR